MLRKLYLCATFINFALLLGFISLFTPFIPSAAAASDYGIVTTGTLAMGGDSEAGNCTETHMENTWAEFMSTNTANEFSYKNSWNYRSNYDNAQATMDAFHDNFVDTLANGSGWAISQVPGAEVGHGAGTSKLIRITLFNGSENVTVGQNALTFDNTAHSESFMINPNVGCRFQAWEYSNSSLTTLQVNATHPVFFVASDHIVYPDGYAGKRVPTSPPPPRNYVALGDSFSSGEGNLPFESGTDIGSGSDKNICHRSASAYPHLLSSSLYLNLTNFVACSGATTSNVINGGSSDGAWGEPAQVAAVSQDTDVITLTVGGNNIGFEDFATACTLSLCDFNTQAYEDIHNKITNNLPSDLADVYQAIDEATSSEARVYVLGYPHVTPQEMPTGASSMCWPFNDGLNNPDPTQNNGATAYAVQTQLNNAIQQGVSDYGSPKFQYVDPNGGNSPFIGHDWCSQDRYFNIVSLPLPWDPNRRAYSYHPNSPGHTAYAAVLKAAAQ